MRSFLDDDIAVKSGGGYFDDLLSGVDIGSIIATDPIVGRYYTQTLDLGKSGELDAPAESTSLFEWLFKREPEPDEYGGIRPFEIFPKQAEEPEAPAITPLQIDPVWEMEEMFRKEAERQAAYNSALEEADRQRSEKEKLYSDEWPKNRERSFGGPNAPINLSGVEKDPMHFGKAVQNILPNYLKNRAGATMIAAFEKQMALDNELPEDVLKETAAYLWGWRPTAEEIERVKSEPDNSPLLEGARLPALTDVEAAMLMRADAAKRKGDLKEAERLREEVQQRVVNLAEAADHMAKWAEKNYVHYERPLNYWHNAILSTIESSGHTIGSAIRSGAAWTLGGPMVGTIMSFINTALESESEAGEVLTHLLEEGGKSPEEIRKAVDAARGRNIAVLSITNPLGDYLVFGSEKLAGLLVKGIQGKGILSKALRAGIQKIFPFATAAVPEAVEEVSQSYITSLGTGAPLQENELRDSAVQGALGSIVYGLFGKAARSLVNFATQSAANGKASTATESMLAGVLLAKKGESFMDSLQKVADFRKKSADEVEIAMLPEGLQRNMFELEKAQELIEAGEYEKATDLLSGEMPSKEAYAMTYTPKNRALLALSKLKVGYDEGNTSSMADGVLYTANALISDGDYDGALTVIDAYNERGDVPVISSVEKGKAEAAQAKEVVRAGEAAPTGEQEAAGASEQRAEPIVVDDVAEDALMPPTEKPVEIIQPVWWKDAPLIERHREEIANREKVALIAAGMPEAEADAQSQITASMYVSAARREENPNITPLEWYGVNYPDIVRGERAVVVEEVQPGNDAPDSLQEERAESRDRMGVERPAERVILEKSTWKGTPEQKGLLESLSTIALQNVGDYVGELPMNLIGAMEEDADILRAAGLVYKVKQIYPNGEEVVTEYVNDAPLWEERRRRTEEQNITRELERQAREAREKATPEPAATEAEVRTPHGEASLNRGLHSLVDVESIIPVGDRSNYDQEKIETMADEMLRVGIHPDPLLVRGRSDGRYEVVGDGLRYWAAVRAREKDARRGEMTSAMIVNGDAEVFDNQRRLRGEPVHVVGYTIADRGQMLIDISAITPLAERGDFDASYVNSLAESILELGGLVSPIALVRTGVDSYETIGDDLAYWAAVRAKEINPRFEMVNAFVYEPVQEAANAQEAQASVEEDRTGNMVMAADEARGEPDYVARVENSINERAKSDLFIVKGAELFPNLRPQEHEEAGRLAYLVEKGDLAQDEFDAIVEQWRNENRFRDSDNSAEAEPTDMVESVREEVSADAYDDSGDDAGHAGPLAEGVPEGVQEVVAGEGVEPGESLRESDADGDGGVEADSSGDVGLRSVGGVEASVLHEAPADAGDDLRVRGGVAPQGSGRGVIAGDGEAITAEVGTGGDAEGPESAFVTPPGLGQSSEAIEATTRRRKKNESKRDGITEIAGENPGNFVIEPNFPLGEGSEAVKIQQNVDALKVLKRVKSEDRYPTREEQAAMARYVGWGGLPGVFDSRNADANNLHGKAQRVLKELLTAEEYNAAAMSTQNAHYTSRDVVGAMWRLARHFGFKGGRVLEPTVGVGNFLGLQPQDMANSTEWHAAELDAVSGEIAAMLYPDANVLFDTGFEDAPFADGVFDLTIGNPPFGAMTIQGGVKPNIRGMRIHNYVIAKSGEHLRPGGVMMMVVTHRFLDTDNAEARSYLADQFKFLGAVRLPNDAFRKNAGTDVVTDIIMLQKLRPGEVADRGAAWLDVNGTVEVDGQNIRVNRYYEENPSHILGRSAMDGKMYARGAGEEYTVHSDGRDLSTAIDELITTNFAGLSGIMIPTAADLNLGAAMLEQSSLPIGGLLLDNEGRIMRREMDDDLGNAVIVEVTKDTLWKDNAKEWEAIVDILTEVRDRGLKGDIYSLLEPFIGVAYKSDGEKYAGPAGYVKALYDIVDAAKEGDFEWRFDAELERIGAAYQRKQLGEKGYARLKGMLDLRNRLLALNAAELSDSPDIETLRSDLNVAYDAFVKKHGFISNLNNLGLLESDVGPEAGLESSYKKGMSKQAAARYGETKAISDEATKADIFFTRVNYPVKEITSADGPVDALKVSLSERGVVDLGYMAGLTNMSPSDIAEELASGDNPQIFMNPITGEYEHADSYLSGNVKRKLAEAEAAGNEKNAAALRRVQPEPKTAKQITPSIRSAWIPDSVFAEFLEALGCREVGVSVIPTTGQIIANAKGYTHSPLGLTYTNNDGKTIVDLFNSAASGKAMTVWRTGPNGERIADAAASERVNNLARRMGEDFQRWGFSDDERTETIVNAFNEKMNTHVPRKYDGVSYLRTVGLTPSLRLRNAQKDAAWRMIQSKTMLHDHVVGLGKTFSNIVGVMERKRLGLSRKPLIVVPNHLVVQWAADFYKAYPNAKILAATPADFSRKNRRKLFARMATGDFDAIIIGHSSFERIAQPAEDAVMVLREQVDQLRNALEESRRDKSGSSKRTVKMIQNKIQAYQDRIADFMKKTAKKGEKIGNEEFSLDFKTLGFDYLVVDEAHEFKNLEYATMMDQVVGMNSPEGSAKALDLYVKVRGLLERGGGVSFATGTPVSNSLIEIYTMMKYLAYDELKERGQLFYDAWAGAHVLTDMRAEYTPSQQLKMRNVLSGLTNLSSLQQLYQQFADTITLSKLKEIYRAEMEERNRTEGTNERTDFPVPKVRSGKRHLVIIPASQLQAEVNEWLNARIDNMSPQDRRSDNLLYVMNDARKAALDIRMLLPYADRDGNGKVGTSAREIKRIYDQWNDQKGTQLVFCDLSTPTNQAEARAKETITKGLTLLAGSEKKAKARVAEAAKRQKQARERGDLRSPGEYERLWNEVRESLSSLMDDVGVDEARKIGEFLDDTLNADTAMQSADTGFSVYDDLRRALNEEHGIPLAEIAFIHEYDEAERKEELFKRVRRGLVRVLIGSTAKMGAGMNVQERLVALHHLDSPWRPSDVEQREGRIIRQGNIFYQADPDGFEVEILAYSAEASNDAVMWQILERKASGIEQFRSGEQIDSIAEDSSDAEQFADFKTSSTGNPVYRLELEARRKLAEAEANNAGRLTAHANATAFLRGYDTTKEGYERRLNNALDIGEEHIDVQQGRAVMNNADAVYAKEKAEWDAEKMRVEKEIEAWQNAPEKTRGKKPALPKSPKKPTVLIDEAQSQLEYARRVKKALDDLMDIRRSEDEVTRTVKFGEDFEIEIVRGDPWKGTTNLYEWKVKTRKNGIVVTQEAFSLADPRGSGLFMRKFDPRFIIGATKAEADKLKGALVSLDKRKAASEQVLETTPSSEDIDNARRTWEWYRVQVAFAEVREDIARDDSRPNRFIENDWRGLRRRPPGELDRTGVVVADDGAEYDLSGITGKVRLAKADGIFAEATRVSDKELVVLRKMEGEDGDTYSLWMEQPTSLKEGGETSRTLFQRGRPASVQDIAQAISSADTSLKQVAATFKSRHFVPGDRNLDIGGGRYDLATDFLAEKGTENVIFDPFNRPPEENTHVIARLRGGENFPTVTVNNVLNVIAEQSVRENVILQAAKAVEDDGAAYFSVYEGNQTGEGRETTKGWQNNAKAEFYMAEVEKFFGDVQRKGNLIVAKNPINTEMKAAWDTGAEGGRTFFQFAGPGAETADHLALSKARDMADRGSSNEDIRRETGWFRGMDGKWRFEISDRGSHWIGDASDGTHTGRLSEVIDHPVLFRAYPDLENIDVIWRIDKDGKNPQGTYNEHQSREHLGLFNITEQIEIEARNTEEAREILLHELQHALQAREDFARGGAPSLGLNQRAEVIHKEMVRELGDRMRPLGFEIAELKDKVAKAEAEGDTESVTAMEKRLSELWDALDKLESEKLGLASRASLEEYRRRAGEIEARDTVSRRRLSDKSRRTSEPDLPSDAIIVWGDREMAYSSAFYQPQTALQLDADYMAAVERFLNADEFDRDDEMEIIQDMVYEAAEAAGYGFSHRREATKDPRQTGYVILFAENRDANEGYGEHEYVARLKLLPEVPKWAIKWHARSEEMREWAEYYDVTDKDEMFDQASSEMNPPRIVETALFWDDAAAVARFLEENEGRLKRGKIAGFRTPDGAVVFDSYNHPEVIKSAAPITYDDQGNVIPLSQRFDITRDDLRYQGEGDDAKGSITFFRDRETRETTRRPEIQLFENADASTFMHESAHFFLNDLITRVNAESQSAETLDLFRRLDNWLKFTKDTDGNIVVSESEHEKFAVGFEHYLERGVAPKGAKGLQAVFEKFKAWLKEIFSFARRDGVSMSEKVANIYDRFLTTPEERTAAEESAAREVTAEAAPKETITKETLEAEPTPSGAATGSIYGSETTVRAPGFPKPFTVRYKAVEASDLVTSHKTNLSVDDAYPAELQPRDRARAASLQQVERMAPNLDVHRLGEGKFSNESGAPILAPGGNVVVVGNGRGIAIKAAYERGLADQYKAWVRGDAAEFGLDPETVEAMDEPVLVREIAEDMPEGELIRFANASNLDPNAAMSVTEQAVSDAKALDNALLNKLGVRGGITADFLGEFLRRVVGDAEKGAYIDADGNPSTAAVERAENALFEYAYDSPWLTALRSEREDSDVITVTNALARSAGAFAKAKMAIQEGLLADVDLTAPIEGAVRFFQMMKREGFTAKGRDKQANRERADGALSQAWIFGDYEQDSAETIIAEYINENSRSAKAISRMLEAYVEEFRRHGPPTRGLFGDDVVSVSVRTLARNAVETVNSPQGLFDFMTPGGNMELAGEQRAWEAPKPSENPEAQALGLRKIRDLVKKILPLRFKNTQKRTGVYKSHEEIARIAESYDFPAAMHEVGHHVMDVLNLNTKLPKGTLAELRKLGKQTARPGASENVVLAEGVAQFVQYYMINEAAAKDAAPVFFLEFEARLKDPSTDAEFLANLMDLQEAVNDFYAASPESRVLAHVRSAADKKPYMKTQMSSKIRRALFKTYETLVDDKQAWKLLTGMVEASPEGKAEMERNGGYLPDKLDFYAQVMTLAGYKKQADSDVDTMMSFVKGLNETEYEQLLAYAVSLQSLEYYDNDMNPGTGGRSDHEAVIARTPEKVKRALEGLQDAYNGMMERTLVETGIISQEGYEAMREKWQNYVPFMRDLDEAGFIDWLTKGGPKRGSTLQSYVDILNPVKKRTGVGDHERTEIFDPVEVMIHNAVIFHGLKSRNDFAKMLVDAARELKGFGWLAERVDPMVDRDMKEHAVFYVWRDGKKEYYATDAELYPLLKGMYGGGDPSNAWWRVALGVMEGSAEILKMGTTRYNPAFIIKNFIDDALAAGVQSESWTPPFIATLRGVLLQLSKKPEHRQLIEDAINDGVFYSAITSLPRGDSLEDIAKELRKAREEASAGGMERIFRSLMKSFVGVAEGVGNINEIIEMGPKIHEYEYIRRNKPQMGRKRAAMEAREVNIDFSRAGTAGRKINRVVAFFNPSVQGIDKMGRTLLERPVQSLAKVMLYMVLPAVLLRLKIMSNPDDEEKYQQMNPDLRNTHFVFPVRSETLGTNVWVRIPKSQEWWVLPAIFEHAITDAAKSDPEAWRGFAQSVAGDLVPPLIPTVAAPVIEVWRNKSFFTGRPIVSKKYEHLPADLQYRVDTSETAKLLGRWTGLSPIMLDHMWGQYTGTVGAETLSLAEAAFEHVGVKAGLMDERTKLEAKKASDLPFFRRFFYDTTRAGEPLNRFYEYHDQMLEDKKRAEFNGVPFADRPLLREFNSARKRFTELNKRKDRIRMDEKLSREKKRELMDILEMEAAARAKAAMNLYYKVKQK